MMSTYSRSRVTVEPVNGVATRSPVVAAGGVAAVLSGLVMAVHEYWDDRVPGVQEGVVPSALHTTWVALMFVGFLGLAALHRPVFGRMGKIAAALALAGSGALSVWSLIDTFRFVGSDARPIGDPAPPVMVLMFAVFGCYVAGLLLFPVAILRAHVLPRSAGILLLMAVLLKLFASSVVPGTLALMGAAFAWMGFCALRVQRSHRADRLPSPAEA